MNGKISGDYIPAPSGVMILWEKNHKNGGTKQQGIYYLSTMAEHSIGDALKIFLQSSRLKGNVQSLQITDIWEQIMGKTIARYTEKIQIVQHTLFITTSVAPLKNELFFQKQKIIQRINEALGERVITEVVIR